MSCQRLFSKYLLEESSRAPVIDVIVPASPIATKEAAQLRDLIDQRDHEIRILFPCPHFQTHGEAAFSF
ncbi:unnamed protein product [Protopolystoma xenopodis]|uniref:Uncharacterized protein n=1 Tax=Protopolystoma xenopodis TaxID=117903 RepID=A0A3S5FDY0_9PLAT|nr:unnamed protein product [Protopolystoma xenopodis]